MVVRRSPLGSLLFAACVACGLRAQDTGAGAGDDWLKLLDTKVETAAKGERQSLSEAPAIISVITGDEIRAMGYRSVAQALASVPGFYGIDDRVAPNIGIRGISGGMRAYSRILKLMIDGQPIAFHPDGANFMGPEAIPLESVARIEVIRGPASSLYGADAFLGVVNIITRKLDQDRQANAVLARAGTGVNERLRDVEARFGVLKDTWDFSLAACAGWEDRSGDALPPSSPILITHPGLTGQTSRDDTSQPFSALLTAAALPTEGLTLSLLGYFSHLDTHGEFLDFGVLSHENRLVLERTYGRLKLDWALSGTFSLVASLAAGTGGPGDQEQLDSGEATTHPRRDFGFNSTEGVLEGRWRLGERSSLVVGADQCWDREKLMTVYTVNEVDGTASPALEAQGYKTFSNRGAYGQLLVYPIRDLGFTLNVRNDHHNIYGDKTTYRMGLVYSPGSLFYAKGLVGTSFKAPSAWQLYAQPLFGGEVIGNPALKPESARTWEVEVGWRPCEAFHGSLTAFWNKVHDKVELVQQSGNQIPTNVGLLDSHGLEAQVQATLGNHQFTGSLAWQRTDSHTPVPFSADLVEPTSMYPSLTAYLRWRWAYAASQAGGLEARYASDRRSTDSNSIENFLTPYRLGSYQLMDAFWSANWKAQAYVWRTQVRLENALNRKFVEPGFAGVDVPGWGRRWVATFGYQF